MPNAPALVAELVSPRVELIPDGWFAGDPCYNVAMPWSQRSSEIDGRPTNILIDERFREEAPIPELPWLSWFGVYGQNDPTGAFWHPDETEALDTIERELLDLCATFGRGWAVYVMRVDSQGIREYFLYRGENAELQNVLPRLAKAHPTYKIEFDEKYDADWERYKSFLP